MYVHCTWYMFCMWYNMYVQLHRNPTDQDTLKWRHLDKQDTFRCPKLPVCINNQDTVLFRTFPDIPRGAWTGEFPLLTLVLVSSIVLSIPILPPPLTSLCTCTCMYSTCACTCMYNMVALGAYITKKGQRYFDPAYQWYECVHVCVLVCVSLGWQAL